MDTLSVAMQESVRQSLQFIGLSSMPPQSVLVAALTVKGVRLKRGGGGSSLLDERVGELSGRLKREEDAEDDDVEEVELVDGAASASFVPVRYGKDRKQFEASSQESKERADGGSGRIAMRRGSGRGASCQTRAAG